MLSLEGLRIVVTRAVQQAEELAQPLRERGAIPILLPVIDIAPPADPTALANAISQIDCYDWIVFSSVNGVRALGEGFNRRARIATVGAATRSFAEKRGWKVSVTPDIYVAEALVKALGNEDLSGRHVLIPGAAVTRDVVREELMRRGALVDLVEAYRNVLPPEASQKAHAVFQAPLPDWITFASSSAVDNLLALVSVDILRHTRIASIGPVTSNTIRGHSLTVAAEPEVHTIAGLVTAIENCVL
jgi:uroporphyrinogen III methyltransferase / synthase